MRYLSEYSKQHIVYLIFRVRFRLRPRRRETFPFPSGIAFFAD
jgi:hypothetical protein